MTTPPSSPLELEGHEQQTFRAFLTAARLLSNAIGQELRRETGMTKIHFEVLSRLEEAPGHRMNLGALARDMAVSSSRLSHIMNRLEELSWVRRLDNPRDGRFHLAELTDGGLTAFHRAALRHTRFAQERFLAPLSAEQVGQLRQISNTLLAQPPSGAPLTGPRDRPGEAAPDAVEADVYGTGPTLRL
ncbi:MarR family transcriptional regulator [Streptomyces sp. NPDC051219]|uniref:MarR family winged helix-turn-helix transcriptional regulator n=1 Tax=Streptomyces sp. NPDC051219 TaxID=3155283 RepID=UPI003442012C